MAAGRFYVLSRWVGAVATPSACIPKVVAPLRPPTAFCRYASSSRRVGRTRGEQYGSRRDEDDDDEDDIMKEVEDKLNVLLEENKRKQKMIKYNKLHRKMTPSGAPERTLSWEAMETIRYLKREHPDEWTIGQLSEGFSVSPEVIQRVLRTKFNPTPHRKAEQDAKVMSRLQRSALPLGEIRTEQSQSALHAGRSPRQFLPTRNPEAALVPVTGSTDKPSIKASALVTVPVMPPKCHKDAAATTTWPAQDDSANANLAEAEDETWDGQVLSEEELEKFQGTKAEPVLQVGNDFFDCNGHFLYRIY
ncbi:neugrin [Syngnathus acus]|uniref:neugrin n=1 Tax=Syngnathus acus TaxID=161584 RepID=UPI001885E2C3|nr:neugrin [Syngnathus acus]